MSDKQWYMTVGVPGGEYAVLAETLEDCKRQFGVQPFPYHYRLCPPDLVEWIEAKLWEYSSLPDDADFLTKVPGGWIRDSVPSATSVYIPVAGAAGLTVLSDA